MTRRAKDAQAQNRQTASAQTDTHTLEAIATAVAELMARYSFDLGSYSLTGWTELWLSQYSPLWLRSAVIEALYQGRYKAVSVWQILDLWQRRGQPLHHFNREFERMVVGRSFQLLFPAEPTYSGSSSGLIAIPQTRPQAAAVPAPAAQDACNGQKPGLGQPDSARLISLPGQRIQAQVNPDASLIRAAASSPVIQPFKPAPERLSLPDRHQFIQPRSVSAPVQRFIPLSDRSEFHTKLKSMAAALIRANAHTLTNAIATTPSRPESTGDIANGRPEVQQPTVAEAATILPSPETQAEHN